MSEFVTKKEEEENKTYFVGPELRGRRRRENGWLMQDFPSQFGKSGQDQTRLGFPKFVTENGWLMLDFPSQIWEDSWGQLAKRACRPQGLEGEPQSSSNF